MEEIIYESKATFKLLVSGAGVALSPSERKETFPPYIIG